MKIYKNILNNEFCDFLINKIKNECVLSESHKTDWYVWLIWGEQPSQKLLKEYWNNEILNLINVELNKSNCDFDMKNLIWLQMTEYENNRWLRRHVDGAHNKTAIFILSDGFDGGETYIADKKIDIKKGDAVVFDGHHQYHEIKPVTNGIRYALNFWFK